MADDGNESSVLAPAAPDTTPAQVDPLASYSAAQATPMQATAPDISGAVQTPQVAPQTTPASQDPAMVVGAAHQSELAKILHAVGGLLGGDKTYKATPQADGSIKITNDPSTTGEEWRRIAAEALGGAAKGIAVGQGPGGPAKAVGAGIQSGLDFQKNQRDTINKDAEAQQKIIQRNAQNALLNQQVVASAFNNKHMDQEYLNAQADRARKNILELHDHGFESLMTGVKDPKTLAQYAIANPLAVAAHMGVNGDMIYNEPDGLGGVNIYKLSAEAAQSPSQKPTPLEIWSADPEGLTKPLKKQIVNIPAGTKQGEIATTMMATFVANDKLAQTRTEAITNQQKADTEKDKAADAASKTPSEIRANNARAASESSTASLNKAKLDVLKGGGANSAPGAAGLKGEDYLQASGIDQSSWNQIRAAANGDVKMPTASRSPQNQAFRNAVMNYDPTFTDARYETKQNFKTKGDATTVQQLSTALGHLENAQAHSANLGFSPSLATGKTLSGPAAAYNQDLKLFTQEAGKLVANKAITQGEYEDLKKGMDSPVQSIRDSAIAETTKLIGGRVAPILQKYKAGSGQELPITEFFDKPTQQRLIQHGFVQAPGGTSAPTPNPTPQPTPLPQRPQGVTPQASYVQTSDGKHFWIEPGNMAAAKQRDPKLQVLGQ